MPSLEFPRITPDTYKHTESVFDGAANLRTVVMYVKNIRPFVPYLPWSQLTTFHLPFSDIDNETACTFFRQCSSLVECTLHHVPDNQPSPQFTAYVDSIPVPYLKTFKIYFTLPSAHSVLLKSLVLPRLGHFELKYRNANNGPWNPACASVITHSRSLKSLLIQTELPPDALERILQGTPSLVKLDLSYGGVFPDSTLEKIARGMLVPELSMLDCLASDINGVEPYLDMLSERNITDNPAVKIEATILYVQPGFDYQDPMYIEADERVRKFYEAGIEVAITPPLGPKQHDNGLLGSSSVTKILHFHLEL